MVIKYVVRYSNFLSDLEIVYDISINFNATGNVRLVSGQKYSNRAWFGWQEKKCTVSHQVEKASLREADTVTKIIMKTSVTKVRLKQSFQYKIIVCLTDIRNVKRVPYSLHNNSYNTTTNLLVHAQPKNAHDPTYQQGEWSFCSCFV